jgi:V8-like Glu-specific endopeptidase
VRSRKLALLIAPFLLLSMLPATVSAAGPSAQARQRADVLAYWTPARMKSAKWLDVEVDKATGEGKLVPRAGATISPTSGGSFWPASATDDVTLGTGRVYFAFGRSAYICSGSVVTDTRTGYSVVLTAAHCVFDQKKQQFASQWLFIPAFDLSKTYTCASTTYGCWNAAAIRTRSEFTSSRKLTSSALQNDWAFVTVAGGGKQAGSNLQLDATVGGSFALNATGAIGTTMTAIGYPAAAPYDGYELAYCRNPVSTDPGTGGTTYRMACDMTGGSSGGPWVSSSSNTVGFSAQLRSLNSYGYTGDDSMYGPIFNSRTTATFNAANSATSGNQALSGS